MKDLFLKHAGILPPSTPLEVDLYQRHFDLLKEWNEKMALVSRKSIGLSFQNHYADSLHISEFGKKYLLPGKPAYDLGTGAGFPGVIFAIRNPGTKVFLYEKLLKKQTFLTAVVEALKLPNLKLEGPMREERHEGVIFARAVMPPDELFPFLSSRMKYGSRLILNLGSQAPNPQVPPGFRKIGESRYTLPLEAGDRRALAYELFHVEQ